MPRKSDARKSDVQPVEGGAPVEARFALKEDYQSPATAATMTEHTSTTPKPPSNSPPLHKMSHPKATTQTAPVIVPQGHQPTAPVQQQQTGDETEDENPTKQADPSAMTIEDLTLPKSIITRLAKGVLPANTQIQANAVLAMSKSTTVFVNYLASNANDYTLSQGKKTIAPADVFKALEDLEFGFLKERLEAEYNKFNQIQTEKRTSYRAKVKAAKNPNDGPSTGEDSQDISMGDSSALPEEGHKSKKARVDPDATVNTVENDDAETEDDEPQPEDEDEDDDDVVEDDAEDEAQEGGSEAENGMDRVGEGVRREERDEALDGDDSD